MPEAVASFETGPYLQAALFCEHVLDEKDNVKSLIRIIDRLNVQASGADVPEAMPPVQFGYPLVLMFKSGEATGPVRIRITLTRPSGLTDPAALYEGTIVFEGGTRGNNLILRMRTTLTESGPYWFNVYVETRLATKIPFEVRYTFTRVTGQAPGTG